MRHYVLLIMLAGCAPPARDQSPAQTPPAVSAQPRTFALATTPTEKLGTLAPNTGIPVGEKIPDVHALDLDRKDVRVASLLEKGPILLVFYRGGWCPFCNLEIHSLTEAYPEFQKHGVSLVAISVDKPEEEAKTTAQYQIPFPVLSDTDAKIINAFHVVKQVTQEEYSKMRGNDIDLEKFSGNTHHEIAIPAFFLVDREGIVRWAHADPQWQVRPSTEQLLTAIDATFGRAKSP